MFRNEVQSRLEELARQADDWFSVGENGDGSFAVRDSAGASADVTVGERWVDVVARRPLDLGARAFAGGAGSGTLVRVTLAGVSSAAGVSSTRSRGDAVNPLAGAAAGAGPASASTSRTVRKSACMLKPSR